MGGQGRRQAAVDLQKQTLQLRESYTAGMFTPVPGCKGISPQSFHPNSTFYQKLLECGYTYSLHYITQTSICISEAGLALEAGVSSLCSLCTCALPPGGRLRGSVGGRLTVLLTLYFSSEHVQILLANFLNNKSGSHWFTTSILSKSTSLLISTAHIWLSIHYKD